VTKDGTKTKRDDDNDDDDNDENDVDDDDSNDDADAGDDADDDNDDNDNDNDAAVYVSNATIANWSAAAAAPMRRVMNARERTKSATTVDARVPIAKAKTAETDLHIDRESCVRRVLQRTQMNVRRSTRYLPRQETIVIVCSAYNDETTAQVTQGRTRTQR
jgi:hypothetical protein